MKGNGQMKQCRECGQLINPKCTLCDGYNIRDSDDIHEYFCEDCKHIFYWERERKK